MDSRVGRDEIDIVLEDVFESLKISDCNDSRVTSILSVRLHRVLRALYIPVRKVAAWKPLARIGVRGFHPIRAHIVKEKAKNTTPQTSTSDGHFRPNFLAVKIWSESSCE